MNTEILSKKHKIKAALTNLIKLNNRILCQYYPLKNKKKENAKFF